MPPFTFIIPFPHEYLLSFDFIFLFAHWQVRIPASPGRAWLHLPASYRERSWVFMR